MKRQIAMLALLGLFVLPITITTTSVAKPIVTTSAARPVPKPAAFIDCWAYYDEVKAYCLAEHIPYQEAVAIAWIEFCWCLRNSGNVPPESMCSSSRTELSPAAQEILARFEESH